MFDEYMIWPMNSLMKIMMSSQSRLWAGIKISLSSDSNIIRMMQIRNYYGVRTHLVKGQGDRGRGKEKQ